MSGRSVGGRAQELEEVAAGYRGYLLVERGLSDETLASYVPRARRFLEQRDGLRGLRLDLLTAADVSDFLVAECPSLSVASAQVLVTAVRSLLGYLHWAGLIAAPLDWAVPAVAAVRSRSLPRALAPAAITALLGTCDRRRTVGRRDYAILLLLSRLGLRASEVAGLRLDDIRWRAGELVVHGKGARVDSLPLPVDIGEALASYLRRRPPAGSCRSLFLRTTEARAMSRQTVGRVVRIACSRAGIPPVGCHRLRHTAASSMLRAGASLEEIGQVLRHRERRTTAIYARVDRATLTAVAMPWPGARS